MSLFLLKIPILCLINLQWFPVISVWLGLFNFLICCFFVHHQTQKSPKTFKWHHGTAAVCLWLGATTETTCTSSWPPSISTEQTTSSTKSLFGTKNQIWNWPCPICLLAAESSLACRRFAKKGWIPITAAWSSTTETLVRTQQVHSPSLHLWKFSVIQGLLV